MTGIVIIYECPEKTKQKEGGKMEDAQIIDLIYDRSEQGLSELDVNTESCLCRLRAEFFAAMKMPKNV